VGVLAIDLGAMVILDLKSAVGRLQAFGEVELNFSRRTLELALNRRLRPLKRTMCRREADAENPDDKREE